MKKHLLALALIAATGAANAAVMSYNFSNVEQTTEINQTGALGLFDSTLGTLTGVSLILNGSMTTTIDLSHTSSGSASGRATGQVTLDFFTTLAGLDLSGATIDLTASTGNQTLAPNTVVSFGPLTDSDSVTLSPLTSLFSVAGGGTFGISCESLSGITALGFSGNANAVQASSAACGAEITYTYDAAPLPPPPAQVPEPASMALIGLGALGLAAIRRRK